MYIETGEREKKTFIEERTNEAVESKKQKKQKKLTPNNKNMVKNMLVINIPPSPYKCNVRRPVLSINIIDTNDINTMTTPTPIVEYLAKSSPSPAIVNILVE